MRRSAVACLLAATALAAAGTASAAGPLAGADVGLYVFVASQGDVQTALEPGELRRLVEGHLAEGLARRGATVHGTDALWPAVSRHRVRTSLLAGGAFLAELAGNPGLDRLQLADLVILPGNLMLAVRDVAVPEGMLTGVRLSEINLREAVFPDDVTDEADRWRLSLARLCSDRATLPGDAPAGRARGTLAVLPFQAHGTDEVAALVASVLLLRHVLNDGTFVVPDPALVATTLQESGLQAHRLDDAGRALVQERLPGRRMLHPALFSYVARSRSGRLEVPGADLVQPEGALLAAGSLSLWLVDLPSGELVRAAENYFELRRETGWFGIRDTRSPVLQLDAALATLWHDFVANQEGF